MNNNRPANLMILKRAWEWNDEGFQYAAFIIEDGLVVDSSQEYDDLFWSSEEEAISRLQCMKTNSVEKIHGSYSIGNKQETYTIVNVSDALKDWLPNLDDKNPLFSIIRKSDK